MATNGEDLYFIDRNATEAERLDFQHRLTVEAFSYVIHPKIQAKLQPGARVAEVGTGTGAWLLNAAQILPSSTEFVGFDISSTLFPSSTAGNIKFATADIKEEFPAELHGTFDLINIRFIVFAMHVSDWEPALQRVLKLLKPGGAIQWTECHYDTMTCLRSGTEYHTYPTYTDVLAKFWPAVGIRSADGTKKLREVVGESVLEGVEADLVSTEREAAKRPLWARMLVPGYAGWAKKALSLSDEGVEKLMDGMHQDIDNGAYLRQDLFTIIGWKPL